LTIRKIILKLFFLCLPFLVVIAIYIYKDPFKVIYHYHTFATDYITPNRDYVSTETFLINNPRYHYDSYIFGTSNSWFYRVRDWLPHIPNSTCYHFDAMNESLYGVERKIAFIHKQGAPLKNALLIVTPRLLGKVTDESGHLFCKDPRLSGKSWLQFQITNLRSFLYPGFLEAYMELMVTHKRRKYMQKYFIINKNSYTHDSVTNEITFNYFDSLIAANETEYYKNRAWVFYNRDTLPRTAGRAIGERSERLLDSIRRYFDIMGTSYRIVIVPLYDQERLDPRDLQALYARFGKENVFDFSGVNSITETIHSYYDVEHCRPYVDSMIMDSIYRRR
jgi:hypothetical protein